MFDRKPPKDASAFDGAHVRVQGMKIRVLQPECVLVRAHIQKKAVAVVETSAVAAHETNFRYLLTPRPAGRRPPPTPSRNILLCAEGRGDSLPSIHPVLHVRGPRAPPPHGGAHLGRRDAGAGPRAEGVLG